MLIKNKIIPSAKKIQYFLEVFCYSIIKRAILIMILCVKNVNDSFGG